MAGAAGIISDDFDTLGVQWSEYDALSNCVPIVANAGNAELALPNSVHNAWAPLTALVLWQPVTNQSNFQITAKFVDITQPASGSHGQGLIVRTPNDPQRNFLRVDAYQTSSTMTVYMATPSQDGTIATEDIPFTATLWLRLTREGTSVWSGEYSTDGAVWNYFGGVSNDDSDSVTSDITTVGGDVSSVGIFAENPDSPFEAYTAKCDFFGVNAARRFMVR